MNGPGDSHHSPWPPREFTQEEYLPEFMGVCEMLNMGGPEDSFQLLTTDKKVTINSPQPVIQQL